MNPLPPPSLRQESGPLLEGPAGRLEILGTSQETAWMQVLRESGGHDFCHLPHYHRVAEQGEEKTARLFVWREAGHLIAMPLLLRPVDPAAPEEWWDATSVYGYGGPITSPAGVPEDVALHFQEALRKALCDLRVVSAFSRLHPLLPQCGLLDGLGECLVRGQTISIDLTQPEEVQWEGYHKKCRISIRKLHQAGFVGVHDRELRHLPEFVEIYHEIMRRVDAQSAYYFDLAYFEMLARELGPALHLFAVFQGREVAAASLATLCGGIMQDFLGGTRDAFLKVSPDRLVVDTERRCAKEMGARVLHLGGGVGLQEDSVFRYKARFSDRRHDFSTWQCVLLPAVYSELCEQKAARDAAQNLHPCHSDYFPAYRCPTVPRTEGFRP